MSLNLLGCSLEKVEEETAGEVATAFFDALYNTKNLEKALTFCTPEFAKEVGKHKTVKQAALRLFNMSYDSVKIHAALGDQKVRAEFNTSGKLTMLFTGDRQGKIYKDLKKVQLIKKGKVWYIESLLPDPVPS
jgi:hypothetical protein